MIIQQQTNSSSSIDFIFIHIFVTAPLSLKKTTRYTLLLLFWREKPAGTSWMEQVMTIDFLIMLYPLHPNREGTNGTNHVVSSAACGTRTATLQRAKQLSSSVLMTQEPKDKILPRFIIS
mmetsp:Transcript_68071/g.156196  ORF Transcript_68071/g.156196 Transcript_68071/m.156196 type:complete len:120 (-) Transcript_68071:85-444(-)